jgi:hypothetical protein
MFSLLSSTPWRHVGKWSSFRVSRIGVYAWRK